MAEAGLGKWLEEEDVGEPEGQVRLGESWLGALPCPAQGSSLQVGPASLGVGDGLVPWGDALTGGS